MNLPKHLPFLILCLLSLFLQACGPAHPPYKPWVQRVEERRAEMRQRLADAREQETRMQQKTPLFAPSRPLEERFRSFGHTLQELQLSYEQYPALTPLQRQKKAKVIDRLLFIRNDYRSLAFYHPEITAASRSVQLRVLEDRLEQLRSESLEALTRY